MNPTPEIPNPAPTPSLPSNRYALVPMKGAINPLHTFEHLLKQPGSLFYELQQGRAAAVLMSLMAVIGLCLAIYGSVAGSLTGGSQMGIAASKILIGSFASILICLPSLYIFLCLSGAEIRLRELTGLVLSAEALIASLLIGFAPVVWVFSQSTDSLAFMAFLHLSFWLVAVIFGMRLLRIGVHLNGGEPRGGLTVWMGIFILVSLQMMTALRPILGHSETFLPQNKLFFLLHWLEVLTGKNY